MKLSHTLPAIALSAALASPAFAVSGIADVPSLWPQDGAFEPSPVSSQIATKGTKAIVQPDRENQDR
ncbi:MAG: hypothetical protein AB8B82_15020 [Roseovarius sp.]